MNGRNKNIFEVDYNSYMQGLLNYRDNNAGVSGRKDEDSSHKAEAKKPSSNYNDYLNFLSDDQSWVNTQSNPNTSVTVNLTEDTKAEDTEDTEDKNQPAQPNPSIGEVIVNHPAPTFVTSTSDYVFETKDSQTTLFEREEVLKQFTEIGIEQSDIILTDENKLYILNPKWRIFLKNGGVIANTNAGPHDIDTDRLKLLAKYSPAKGFPCFLSSPSFQNTIKNDTDFQKNLKTLLDKFKKLGVRPDEIIVSTSGISILNPRVFVLLRNTGVIKHHQGCYVKWTHENVSGFDMGKLNDLRIVKNAAYSVSKQQQNFDSKPIEVVNNLKKLGAVATDIVISKNGISIHNPKLLTFLHNTGVIKTEEKNGTNYNNKFNGFLHKNKMDGHNPKLYFQWAQIDEEKLDTVLKQSKGKACVMIKVKSTKKKLEPFVNGLHQMGLSPLEIIVTHEEFIINNAKAVNYLVKSGVLEDNKTIFALDEVPFVDESNNDKLNKMKDAVINFVATEKKLNKVITMLEKKRDDLNAGGIFNKASPEKALALTQLIEKIKAQKESGDPEALKNVKKALVSARDDTVYNDQRTRLPLLFTKKKTDTQLILQKCLNALTLKDDSTLKAEYLSLLR